MQLQALNVMNSNVSSEEDVSCKLVGAQVSLNGLNCENYLKMNNMMISPFSGLLMCNENEDKSLPNSRMIKRCQSPLNQVCSLISFYLF